MGGSLINKRLVSLASLAVFAVLYLSYTSFTGNLTARQPAGLEENQILAITDRDYFPAVNEMLGSANSSIHMIVYSLNYYVDYPDTSVNALVEKLGAASRRGVDVKVVADEQATDKPVITLLKEKGINIKFDKKGTTTHAKLIIIDSKIIIIGSTNWSYYAVDKNHEANVAINSEPLARQFEAYFNGVWLES
jgi:cardiolipin synthase